MQFAPTQQVSAVTTRPAPIKGINAYDSIVAMPEGFALLLRNFFAQSYGCQVRRGYRRHALDLLGKVESLCSHNVGTGVDNLYAFVGSDTEGAMWNVTIPDNELLAPRTPVITGLLNARWQHINFGNIAGVHLVAVNGADNLIWIQPNGNILLVPAGDGTGNTISGVDPKALISLYAHQKRIWFVEKNSSRGWYLPPDQITGNATSFDFGGMWTRGGYLNQIITWTIDDGNGADDHLCAISSQGEVSVYQGTDPNGADTWSLQGVYYAGAPVGRRSAVRFGGDVMMLTQNGLVPLSNMLKSTKVNPTEDNDAKYIQQLVSVAATLVGGNFGWQPFVVPSLNMFILNVPASENNSTQFVLNDITRAWSQFVGYSANCWELHNDRPFFGGFGGVYRAWEGTTDDSYIDKDTGVAVPGNDIYAEAQTSFTYFDSLGRQKHFKMVRPSIISLGGFSMNFSVNTDFVFDSPLAPAAFFTREVARWATGHIPPYLPEEGVWDQSTWQGGLFTFKTWQAVTGIGTAATIRLIIRSATETYWASTDWLYETGGIM